MSYLPADTDVSVIDKRALNSGQRFNFDTVLNKGKKAQLKEEVAT